MPPNLKGKTQYLPADGPPTVTHPTKDLSCRQCFPLPRPFNSTGKRLPSDDGGEPVVAGHGLPGGRFDAGGDVRGSEVGRRLERVHGGTEGPARPELEIEKELRLRSVAFGDE